jgi:Multiubiquitin
MNQPNDLNVEASRDKKEFDIIVNAREKKWFDKEISYDQVIVLAYGIYDPSESTSYTVTYKRGEDKKTEGSMVPGDIIHVKDKMIFNVTKTNKS